ncbi:MAG: hypothetical protein E6J50_02800 [Chloroflexi bacterium]|nr:MAG: hypothetical protein E6J50_02800 [Chloroflexota bacterium]
MNDEQLTRLFRSLDEQAEPDAAFADALFARLEREAHLGGRRRMSGTWALVAAALLLAGAVGAAVAVGSGLLKLPFVVVVASETPEPTSTPFASASPIPSESAAASPTPTPVVIPEPTYLDRLVATPDGFLAVGSAPGTNPPTSAVSVILRGSPDGITWQSMDATRFGTVVDMAVGPSAWILISNTRPDLSGDWVVWRSTNGQTWTSNPAWTSDTITSPLAVKAGPSGFAITGGSFAKALGRSDGAVWTSPDGVRWTRAPISLGYTGGSAVVLDNGFLAYQGCCGDSTAVFASLNGVNWEPASSPPGLSGTEEIAGLLHVGSNLVAVTCNQVPDGACNVSTGRLEGSAGSLAIHWQADAGATQELHGYTATASTGATIGGFIFGYDLATYARLVLSSHDGLSWRRTALAADAFGGGLPNLIAAGGSAAVGIGWTDTTPAGVGRDLWRSTDGMTWSLVSAPLVPPAPQVPGGACPPAPTTVQQLVDIGSVKAAACYGTQSLTLQGFSSNCGGCGGTGLPQMKPDWMSGAYGYGAWYISPQDTKTTVEATRIAVNLLPSAHLTPPGEGAPVIVTGHFNDAAAQECRIVPSLLGSELLPTSDAIGMCERSFVVTAIRNTGS